MLGNINDGFVVCWLVLPFSKIRIRNTFIVSKDFDPDQARQDVGPDQGPNCLQRSSTDGKTRHVQAIKFEPLHEERHVWLKVSFFSIS